MTNRYGAAWQRQRLLILQRDGHRCRYCGNPANQVDHVIPLCDGGPLLDARNLVAACKRCNLARINHPEVVPPGWVGPRFSQASANLPDGLQRKAGNRFDRAGLGRDGAEKRRSGRRMVRFGAIRP